MKLNTKLACLALGLSLSSSAMAVDPQATFVFEGFVPSVVPTAAFMITGPGGVGDPAKGTLTVNVAGEVTTSVPVLFEVRENKDGDVDAPVAGELVTEFKVKLLTSSLTAGSAAVDNAGNQVSLNSVNLVQNDLSLGIKGTNKVEFMNKTGFDIDDVGAGAAVQASVVVLIESIVA